MVRVVLIGCSTLSKQVYKIITRKRGCIVGVFTYSKQLIGRDVGEHFLGQSTGTLAASFVELEALLPAMEAQVAVVAFNDDEASSKVRAVELCTAAGVNSIVTNDGLLLANQNNDIIEKPIKTRLDNLATKQRCTILITGYFDDVLFRVALLATSVSEDVESVEVEVFCDVQQYYDDVTKNNKMTDGLGLNMSRDEFASALESRESRDGSTPVKGNLGGLAMALCNKLDGRALSQYQTYEPYFADSDIENSVTNGMIRKGSTCGLREITTVHTSTGIHIVTSHTVKVFAPSDVAYTTVTVRGPGGSNMVTLNSQHHLQNAASGVVNKIEDVIRAKPGLYFSDQMKTPKFTRDLSAPIRETSAK